MPRHVLIRLAVLGLIVSLLACGRNGAGKDTERPAPAPPAAGDLDRCQSDADCRISAKIPRTLAASDEDFCCAGTCPSWRAYTARRLEALEAEYRQRCPRGHVGCPKTDCRSVPPGTARCVAGACLQVGAKGM